MDQFGACRDRHLPEYFAALLPVTDPRPYLDQLVIVECPRQLGLHGACQAALAQQHDRSQAVTEASQVLALRFAERHAGIIGSRWRGARR